MNKPFSISLLLASFALSGCVESNTTRSTAAPAVTGGDLTGVPTRACRTAIAKQMNRPVSDVAVFDAAESQAGITVEATVAGAPSASPGSLGGRGQDGGLRHRLGARGPCLAARATHAPDRPGLQVPLAGPRPRCRGSSARGPGVGAVEAGALATVYFEGLRARRDVVAFDPRGVDTSAGAETCCLATLADHAGDLGPRVGRRGEGRGQGCAPAPPRSPGPASPRQVVGWRWVPSAVS